MRAGGAERPVRSPKAFGQSGRAAVLSQAAFLLLLGAQIRGDHQALKARAAAAKRQRFVESIPADDAAEFPVPRLRFTGERVSVEQVEASLANRFGRKLSKKLAPRERVSAETLSDLAARLHRRRTPLAAAELMEACLRHRHELPRVAAAAAYLQLTSEPGRLIAVLERGTHSADRLVREVAATALAHVAPEHPRLLEMARAGVPSPGAEPSHTSLLIHGTWAPTQTWWQPGGDFHTYLKGSVRPDLYSGSDRFEWSGGWSDGARALGASDLLTWVNTRNLNGLDLFTHSHGGSVAMLTSHAGLSIGELVLLSCPVHVAKYMPDFTRVTEVVSIRVHLDLVILVDGGGQRFRHPNIRENILPIWFDHFATHDPNVWQTYNVPAML